MVLPPAEHQGDDTITTCTSTTACTLEDSDMEWVEEDDSTTASSHSPRPPHLAQPQVPPPTAPPAPETPKANRRPARPQGSTQPTVLVLFVLCTTLFFTLILTLVVWASQHSMATTPTDDCQAIKGQLSECTTGLLQSKAESRAYRVDLTTCQKALQESSDSQSQPKTALVDALQTALTAAQAEIESLQKQLENCQKDRCEWAATNSNDITDTTTTPEPLDKRQKQRVQKESTNPPLVSIQGFNVNNIQLRRKSNVTVSCTDENGKPGPYDQAWLIKDSAKLICDDANRDGVFDCVVGPLDVGEHTITAVCLNSETGELASDEQTIQLAEIVFAVDVGTDSICMHVVKYESKADVAHKPHKIRLGGPDGCMSSYVAWTTDGDRLVGEEAKRAFLDGRAPPECTVYDVKRLIGRRFSDEVAQQLADFLPYTIRPKCTYETAGDPECDKVVIAIPEHCLSNKQADGRSSSEYIVTPEEITAVLLQTATKMGAAQLNSNLGTDIVFTVPAYFVQSQRESTQDAAKMVSLNTMRVVNEPTAAAIYSSQMTDVDFVTVGRTLVVFDFGGGTLDVSIVYVHQAPGTNTFPQYTVYGAYGATALGGSDFDNVLMMMLTKKLEKLGVEIDKKSRYFGQLKMLAEKAKIELSLKPETNVVFTVDEDGTERKVRWTVKRSDFEKESQHIIKQAVSILAKAIETAKIQPSATDLVALVGGTSAIPAVKQAVEDFFDAEHAYPVFIDLPEPRNAVTHGASAVATMALQKKLTLLTDATPQDIGVKARIGKRGRIGFAKIIPHGTLLPTMPVTKPFKAEEQNPKLIKIELLEGYHQEYPKNTHFLGSFTVDLEGLNITQPEANLKFDVDEDGVLKVSVKVGDIQHTSQLSVLSRSGKMSQEDLNSSARRISEGTLQQLPKIPDSWDPPTYQVQTPEEIAENEAFEDEWESDILVSDIVIAIDATQSMTSHINAVKEYTKTAIKAAYTELTGDDATSAVELRVGFVVYRDWHDDIPMVISPLSSSIDDVLEKIQSVLATGGGDWWEDVTCALDHVNTKEMNWAKHSVKQLIVIGDAPPHSEPLKSRATNSLKAIKKAFKTAGIKVHAVWCTPDIVTEPKDTEKVFSEAKNFFLSLADDGGGLYMQLGSDNALEMEKFFKGVLLIETSEAQKIRYTNRLLREGRSHEEINRQIREGGLFVEYELETDQGTLSTENRPEEEVKEVHLTKRGKKGASNN